MFPEKAKCLYHSAKAQLKLLLLFFFFNQLIYTHIYTYISSTQHVRLRHHSSHLTYTCPSWGLEQDSEHIIICQLQSFHITSPKVSSIKRVHFNSICAHLKCACQHVGLCVKLCNTRATHDHHHINPDDVTQVSYFVRLIFQNIFMQQLQLQSALATPC